MVHQSTNESKNLLGHKHCKCSNRKAKFSLKSQFAFMNLNITETQEISLLVLTI